MAKKVVLEERTTWREELQKIKQLSLSELPGYLWDYYKFHFAVIICCIGLAVLLVSAVTNAQKETVLSGVVLNVSHYSTEENYLETTYLDYLGKTAKEASLDLRMDLTIHTGENNGDLSSSYTWQALSTLLSSDTEDFLICDPDSVDYIQRVTGGIVADLSEVLTADTYKRLDEAGLLHDVHRVEFLEDGSSIVTEELFPGAIDISSTHLSSGMKVSEDQSLYLAFMQNSPAPEHFEEMITYLFDYDPSKPAE